MPIVRDGRRGAHMKLLDFLQVVPAEVAEYVLPSSRVLLLLRTSREMRRTVSAVRCGADIEPNRLMKQTYKDVTTSVTQRQAALRVFMYGSASLTLSAGNLYIASFTMHDIRIDTVGVLCNMLRGSTRLAVLDMCNNHIPEDLLYDVLAAIPPSVQKLRLAKQWISRAAVTPLCALLGRLVVLAELDLSVNYLNSQGMEAITASIASQQLTHVCIGYNHLKSRFWNEHPQLGFDRFVLKKLDLQHNLLQGVYCDSVYACVRRSAAVLTTLDVSHNDLRVLGISCLSACLQHCRGLRHLNVAGNLCGDAAIGLLFGAIRPPTHETSMCLESLDVGNNQLSAISARHLASCLAHNRRLQDSLSNVSFSHNELQDVGAQLLVDALVPCKLAKLFLAHCAMGEATGMFLAGAMQHWPDMQLLDIYANRLGETSLRLIAQNLSANDSKEKELRCLDNYCTFTLAHELQRTVANGRITPAWHLQPWRARA